MNIAVVAAHGKSGRAFVEVALTAGHDVTAGIRRSSPFKPHPNLTIKECDATNPEDVAALLKNADAVVSLIGHVKGSDSFVQTDAMRVIVAAMEEAGISRIVSLTGTGAREEGDTPSQLDVFLNGVIQRLDPARIADGISHVNLLEHSSLDWTVLRVLKLTNRKAGEYTLTKGGPAKLFVPRREVALAMLDVLDDKSFIRSHPVISQVK